MIYAILNHKGGVAKTTTAHAIASGLHKQGYKTLLIDLDDQRNLTYLLKAKEDKTALHLFLGTPASEVIQQTNDGDFIAGDKNLINIDSLLTSTGKEYKLKEALQPIIKNYDFIIIDTPPAQNIVSINALTIADRVTIPVQADIFSLQGLQQINESIIAVKKYCNNKLTIDGLLLTRYSNKANLSKQVADYLQAIAKQLNTKVYNTRIREAIAVKEAQIKQVNLFDYAPQSKATMDYKGFIEELLSVKSK